MHGFPKVHLSPVSADRQHEEARGLMNAALEGMSRYAEAEDSVSIVSLVAAFASMQTQLLCDLYGSEPPDYPEAIRAKLMSLKCVRDSLVLLHTLALAADPLKAIQAIGQNPESAITVYECETHDSPGVEVPKVAREEAQGKPS